MLNFSNPSRSFDAAKKRVEFWGYDNVIEISFFVEMGALKKLCPEMEDVEAGILKAFDASRKQIQDVAEKVHARGRQGVFAHILGAQNF